MNRFPQGYQLPKVLLPVAVTVFQGELLIVG
jgi:hypothetical protein